MNVHQLCPTAGCLRQRIANGRFCEAHTRAYLTSAFLPEWVRRAQEHRLTVRIEGGRAA